MHPTRCFLLRACGASLIALAALGASACSSSESLPDVRAEPDVDLAEAVDFAADEPYELDAPADFALAELEQLLLARLDALESRLAAFELRAPSSAAPDDPLGALLAERLARVEGDVGALSEQLTSVVDGRLAELEATLLGLLESWSSEALSEVLRELLAEALAASGERAVEAVLSEALDGAIEPELLVEDPPDGREPPEEGAQDAPAGELLRSGSQAWTIAPAPDMQGRLGRLEVYFPEGVHGGNTQTSLRQGSVEEPGPSLKSFWGGSTVEVFPGRYLVLVHGVPLTEVEVRPRCVTRIVPGSLRVQVGGSTQWSVRLPGGERSLYSAWGENEIGLPAGDYDLTVLDRTEHVRVRSGERSVW